MEIEIPEDYSKTEMGILPKQWKVYSIGELVENSIIEKPLDGNHGNIHPKSTDFVDDGIPFIMANSVFEGVVDLKNCSFIRKEQADNLQKGFSITGDVLLTHKGTVGNVALVDQISTPYIMLTPQVTYYRVKDKSRITNTFIRYYFESAKFQAILQSLSGGGTRAYIGITKQRQLPFILPPLPEQKAIAQALSDADAAIAELDRLITKQRNIKQGTIQQLLTGKQRLPGFSGEWEVKKLGEMVNKIVGGGTPSRNKKEYWNGNIFWATVKDITSFCPYETEEKITQEGLNFSASNLIEKGTLILSTRMAVGKVVIYDVDVAINQDLKAIITKSDIDTQFLFYCFANNSSNIDFLASGSTVKGISVQDLKNIEFPYLSLAEQKAITQILSDMDAEIEALEQKRDKYKAIKQGMMQELLTGRTRLV